MAETKTAAIIGLGYVGLPLAILLAKKGYRVIGIDINAERVGQINKGIVPFKDGEMMKDLALYPIKATTDAGEIRNASVIIMCVPTPVYENLMPNLELVSAAAKSIAPHLKKGAGQLVILESTVNPGVSETIVLPILEEGSGLICGRDFYLAHCPERVNPGDTKWTVENINRVVGGFDQQSLDHAATFYESVLQAGVKKMESLKEAEAVKIVENSFRDINIAFVNEMAKSFARMGIDAVNVINGAATKPFAFLPHYPSRGVGGHCIPVDPYYLIEYAKEQGFDHQFLALARKINDSMPDYTAELVMKALNEKKKPMNGAKIAVLGLAYKGDIDDCRESPSFQIIKHLQEYNADVVSYDPYVLARSSVSTLDDALIGADAVVIATGHSAFKTLTPETLKHFGVDTVIDGVNCLDKHLFVRAGINYSGIGRVTKLPNGADSLLNGLNEHNTKLTV